MDASDAVTGLRLIVAIAILSYASVLDWRTRRIDNIYWIGISIVGLVLLPIQVGLDDEPWEYLLVVIPILAILSDVYWDTDEKSGFPNLAPAVKYAISIIAIILLGYLWVNEAYFQHLLAIPVMMLFIVLMYMLDVIRGGADAKALMALSILFPFHPALDSLPFIRSDTDAGEVLFPFAFVVLMTAAIIVAFFPLGFMTKNISAREFRFPQGLLGYKMNASDIKGRHVWLMERIEGGNHTTYSKPKASEDIDSEVAALVKAGHTRIWVTPKVPFIIPILAALVFSTIVGNILSPLF